MASGQQLIFFDALEGNQGALTSNYATWNTRNGHYVQEFDTTTQETLYFEGEMPAHYGGGNIVVKSKSMLASATSGSLGYGFTFERLDTGGQDLDSDGFATEQLGTPVTVPGTSGAIVEFSITHTAGSGGTDSIAAGDRFRLRVRRDVANDTATGDGQLLSVTLTEA